MIVLSLFDGISCGYAALDKIRQENSDFPSVTKYYASEISESAIKIAMHNHADIIEIGDVRNIEYNQGILTTEKGTFEVGHIDLLMGGSPCTDFSNIGAQKEMTFEDIIVNTPEDYMRYKDAGYQFTGESYLFWEFVRLFESINPTYVLLENVPMRGRCADQLKQILGLNSITINSDLVSAQNRNRQYWTDIPNVTVPEDRNITLDQILDPNADTKDCSDSIIVQKNLPKFIKKYQFIPERFNAYNATPVKDKACTLTKGSMVTSSCATLIWVKVPDGVHIVKDGVLDNKYAVKLEDGKYNLRRLNLLEMERLQTLPDGYTDVDGVGVQGRSECIGNGWTVDVIAHILKNMRF